MRKKLSAGLILASFLLLSGFDLDHSIVPRDQIISGGVPRDGIPAILHPRFLKPEKAGFLTPEDEVIGIARAGEAKAYPLKILVWHEAVNDTLGGEPVLVTF